MDSSDASGAGNREPAEVGSLVSPTQFLAFLDKVENSVEAGEPRRLSGEERRRVRSLCDELRGMLDGVESMEALNENQRATIFNKSQELWAMVSGNREDQVICRKERQVGTNFQRTRCRTVRELRRADREADLFLRELRRPGGL